MEREFKFAVDEFPPNGELAALWAVTWPFSATDDFQASLRACLLHITARREGRLAGFVKVASDGGMLAFLLDPTVHPDFARRGLGTELVKRAADLSKQRGARYLHVDFLPHLRSLCAGCGFQPTDAGLMTL